REESGKKLPGFVTKHLEKCSDCRSYRGLSLQLSSVNPYNDISDQSMADLNRKISANLFNNKSEENKLRTGLFSPVPLVALFFIMIFSIGVLLFQGINKPSKNGEVKPLIKLTAARDIKDLNDLFSKVENPIKKEAEELKRSVNSAGEYLKSVMDFGLPGIPD
ncbi:MAG: hypothetical protein ABFR36_10725, partial [Acidobacteriota bacterium]